MKYEAFAQTQVNLKKGSSDIRSFFLTCVKIEHFICICCGSILSLVQNLFSFVLGMVMYDNEFKTKENKI